MAGQPEALTTWRGCALYAKSLLEHAHLDPQLHPHRQALMEGIQFLLAQEARPAASPGFPPPAAPETYAQPQPAPAASPWGAAPHAAQSSEPMAAPAHVAAPAPTGPVHTQTETPTQPMRVLTYGRNDKGTLGHGHIRPPGWEPLREVSIDGEVIVWASGGSSNCAFLTQTGHLYFSGSNASYLFSDRQARGREFPALPELLQGKRVGRVFFGADAAHVFAVVDGRLHAWGRQANALGIDTRSPTLFPKPLERLGSASQAGGLPGDVVRQMALTNTHTVALLADASLALTGVNARGQLGVGARNNPFETFVFVPPEGMGGVRFSKVAAYTMHTAAISEQGELFCCGRNESGELGQTSREDHFRFTRVGAGTIAGRRVVEVACTEATTLCVTEDGELHGAGSNGRGELGLGEHPDSDVFVSIPLPGGRTVKQVATGKHHILVLCTDGSLFSWGDNNQGQVTPGATSRFVKTPTQVQGIEHPVLGIAAGEAHCMVMVG